MSRLVLMSAQASSLWQPWQANCPSFLWRQIGVRPSVSQPSWVVGLQPTHLPSRQSCPLAQSEWPTQGTHGSPDIMDASQIKPCRSPSHPRSGCKGSQGTQRPLRWSQTGGKPGVSRQSAWLVQPSQKVDKLSAVARQKREPASEQPTFEPRIQTLQRPEAVSQNRLWQSVGAKPHARHWPSSQMGDEGFTQSPLTVHICCMSHPGTSSINVSQSLSIRSQTSMATGPQFPQAFRTDSSTIPSQSSSRWLHSSIRLG